MLPSDLGVISGLGSLSVPRRVRRVADRLLEAARRPGTGPDLIVDGAPSSHGAATEQPRRIRDPRLGRGMCRQGGVGRRSSAVTMVAMVLCLQWFNAMERKHPSNPPELRLRPDHVARGSRHHASEHMRQFVHGCGRPT